MASGIMRVPRTTGLPDTLPGTHSISSHCVQSMSELVYAFVMFLTSEYASLASEAPANNSDGPQDERRKEYDGSSERQDLRTGS